MFFYVINTRESYFHFFFLLGLAIFLKRIKETKEYYKLVKFTMPFCKNYQIIMK